ncbi:membrane protein containing Signal transduction response regulator, receiver region [Candidatus Magnetobacterium bavaricum]|uniref:Sensory/regulatory protein RpfC n=1 Tax=Candidatus Magnetobacterium bavaricum TaxID=29290 RepID=A0A0F3GTA1_9BACT|nr:membrane protein containing Signal transduction response regulator, receiver region [Candidatus Magnetobacterium bavaricum]
MNISFNLKGFVFAIIMLCAGAITLYFTVEWTKASTIYNIAEESIEHLGIYNNYLINKISTHSIYPKILAESKLIIEFCDAPTATETVNRHLEQFNSAIGAEVSYIIDRDGITIASSNWSKSNSFVGKNYSFRPYFKQSLQGLVGKYVAVGVTSRRPGYYVSYPVKKDNEVIGVAVLKSDTDILKPSEYAIKGKMFIADNNDVIFEANDDKYEFYAMHNLSAETLANIRRDKQYEGINLSPLPIKDETVFRGITLVTLNSTKYVVTTLPITDNGWRLYLFSDIPELDEKIFINIAIEFLVIAIIILLFLLINYVRLKRSKRALLKRHEELEVMVNTRTEELQISNKMLIAAKEEAEKANRAKTDFLANMSHEIRTPMNAIVGMTDLAMEISADNKQKEYLSIVKGSANALLTIIDEILDMIKIGDGRLEIREVDLPIKAVVISSIDMFAINAIKKGLKLSYHISPDVPDVLRGDPARLRQVIINLIGNALKYTDKGEIEVKLKISDEQRQDNTINILFSVRDTGIGIPTDRTEMIFQRFTQADSSKTRNYGGAGIGLAISMEIVHLMGGKIWVESEVVQGSTFFFTVNMKMSDNADLSDIEDYKTAHKPAPVKPQHTLKILIADDIIENSRLLKTRLERYKHTVFLATTGLEAVECFKREGLDVILMDIQMPEMGGLEATRLIRELEASDNGHIPIIAFTAGAVDEEKALYLKEGMDAVIDKVTETDKLMSIIGNTVPRGVGAVYSGPVNQEIISGGGLPLLDGIDVNKGIGIWNDAQAYRMALIGFSADYGDAADKISSLLENGDIEGAYRIAHSIDGLSGNLSMPDVFRVARELSHSLKKRDIDSARVLLIQLRDLLTIVVNSISSIGQQQVDAVYQDAGESGITDDDRHRETTEAQYSVLIVDDEANNRQLLRQILEDKYRLLFAANGSTALEIVAKARPDMILLDIMMPAMDGYETCRRLKSVAETSDIPVIFISALSDITDKVNAFNSGGVDYIPKPFQGAEVISRIDTHLKLYHLQRFLEERVEEEVNKRRQDEQMLIQQSRMAAMGEMLSMIAHQWRQPLASIASIAGDMEVALMLDDINKDDFSNALNDINAQAQHLSKTINDFRHFFNPMKNKEDIYLDSIINHAMIIMKNSLEYNSITLEIDCSITTSIRTYANEITQVLLNVIKNAQEAILKRQTQKPVITITCKDDDGFVSLDIQDNAGGIAEDIIGKIFNPYFTTKNEANGTGLGLYMSKMIIERHCSGELSVKNMGQGACFTIRLPYKTEEEVSK